MDQMTSAQTWSSKSWCLGIALLFALAALVGVGCGGSADRSEEERPIEWAFWEATGKREVTIVGQDDYCVGTPKSRIKEVVTQYEGDRVYLTAILRDPPGSSGGEGKDCLGVIRAVYKTVQLDRPVQGAVLLDASVDPPEQRWPD
jgi:hypothetical protein